MSRAVPRVEVSKRLRIWPAKKMVNISMVFGTIGQSLGIHQPADSLKTQWRHWLVPSRFDSNKWSNTDIFLAAVLNQATYFLHFMFLLSEISVRKPGALSDVWSQPQPRRKLVVGRPWDCKRFSAPWRAWCYTIQPYSVTTNLSDDLFCAMEMVDGNGG